MPQHREDARPVVSHGASLFLAGAIFSENLGQAAQALPSCTFGLPRPYREASFAGVADELSGI
jgi:hypothetical protein